MECNNKVLEIINLYLMADEEVQSVVKEILNASDSEPEAEDE